jgi:hypothetical protein
MDCHAHMGGLGAQGNNNHPRNGLKNRWQVIEIEKLFK